MSRLPDGAPGGFGRFGTEPRQLGVGSTGKTGALRISLERGSDGRTFLKEQFSTVPFHLMGAMYHDPQEPHMAYIYVASASGGVLQGDRYEIEIRVGPAAAAHITTQGASRIYGMNSNYASQHASITMEEGSYLEYMPDQIIPYADSRYHQSASITVSDTSILVCSEVVAPGRAGMGESFKYDICSLETSIYGHDGAPRMIDPMRLEPGRQNLKLPWIMGGMDTLGTVYVAAPARNVPKLEDAIQDVLSRHPDGLVFGTGRMAGDSGLLVRMAGVGTGRIREAVWQAAGEARRMFRGTDMPDMRKG